MKVLVIGCGRLGQGVFWQLRSLNHDVIMIENEQVDIQQFSKKASDAVIIGPLFAQDTLKRAGIERCDAVIACTPSDETNAVLARVAQQTYRVPKVIARLYDPLKAGMYAAFGIQTLATTLWGVQRATELLTYSHLDSVYELNHGEVRIVTVQVPQFWCGKNVAQFNVGSEIQVVSIQRNNQAFIPEGTTVLLEGDELYVVVNEFASQQLEAMLGMRG